MTDTSAARKPHLPSALAKLRRAVDRLITPSTTYMNNTYIEIPSLYQQLCDGIDSYRGNAVNSVARSRPPLWVEAEDQRSNIDLMVSVWPTGAAGDTRRQLRAMATKTWTVEQTPQVRRLASIIDSWCDDIVVLLNEQHAHHITAPCPTCGETTVYHLDSAGERVRTPALRIVDGYGATCGNCGYYWAPSAYVDLAKQLGCGLPAGVLE